MLTMTLADWYQTMFALRHYHKWRDEDILDWLPFERDLYVHMLLKALEEEKSITDKLQR